MYKRLFLIAIFLLSKGYAQTLSNEEEAVRYFLNKCKDDVAFHDLAFKTPKYTMAKIGDVYYLADAVGDINLLRGIIPNRPALDSIKLYNETVNPTLIKKSLKSYKVNSKDGISYDMGVYHAISYKGYDFVQILLLNVKKKREKWIFVRFANNKPDSLYFKSFRYH